jgi:hypothetical protein
MKIGTCIDEAIALASIARFGEETAVLDEPEDAVHLADGGLLAADVVHVDPEVRVVGVDHRLADSGVEVERPEEQHEVRAQQEQEIDELGQGKSEEVGQRGQRLLGSEAEEQVGRGEVEDRDEGDVDRTLPEDRPVGFDGALHYVRLGRDALADDQPPANDAQDPACQQHRDHRVEQRPPDAELQRDQRVCEGGGADEEREDPEDDHGGVSPLYVVGFQSANRDCGGRTSATRMISATPSAINRSPGL